FLDLETSSTCHDFFPRHRHPPLSTLFPYTTLFRSNGGLSTLVVPLQSSCSSVQSSTQLETDSSAATCATATPLARSSTMMSSSRDRKSTRLNSSHSQISYAVFCLKKKNVKLLQLVF